MTLGIRRLFFPIILVVAGFIAGLVVTGRMRTASESHAEAARPAPAPADAPQHAGAGAVAVANGPDLTRAAGRPLTVAANIRALQVVGSASPLAGHPFLRYLCGDQHAMLARHRPSH